MSSLFNIAKAGIEVCYALNEPLIAKTGVQILGTLASKVQTIAQDIFSVIKEKTLAELKALNDARLAKKIQENLKNAPKDEDDEDADLTPVGFFKWGRNEPIYFKN
jgi:hypothetical protein